MPANAMAAIISQVRYIHVRAVRKLQPPIQMCVKAAESITDLQFTCTTALSLLLSVLPADAATSSCSPERVPVVNHVRRYHQPATRNARPNEANIPAMIFPRWLRVRAIDNPATAGSKGKKQRA